MGKDQELIEAARGGNYPAVERILNTSKHKKAGPFASLRRGGPGGVATRDTNGYTALHYAALNGHKDVVQLLMSYEASTNSVDEAGSSPLHLAAWAGHLEVVGVLLTSGPSVPNVNLTNGDKETALHCAAQYGHTEVVRLLLDAGADPNIKNSKEETPLDHAAQYGRLDSVMILLESHPEMVGKYTAYGAMVYTHTPLHLASRNGHTGVVEELIKVGIDINVKTVRGSALHEASLCGKVEVVKSLLRHKISTNILDQDGRTVLEMLTELPSQRTREICKIIVDYNQLGIVDSTPSNMNLLSPYDNISLTQSLGDNASTLSSISGHGALTADEASPTSSSPPTLRRPRATTWQASRAARTAHKRRSCCSTRGGGVSGAKARGAVSVEDLLGYSENKRVSSTFSTTSGCSDCTTTSTLQGAKSYDSNFLSESEMTVTLTRGDEDLDVDEDDTSISSASSTNSISPACGAAEGHGTSRPGSSVSQNTLTGKRPKIRNSAQGTKVQESNAHIFPRASKLEKPKLPAKPAHIRPGLKPVQIPNVDDKLGIKPKKPPRSSAGNNSAASPSKSTTSVTGQGGQTLGRMESEPLQRQRTVTDGSSRSASAFSAKVCSKSFDELDDMRSSDSKGSSRWERCQSQQLTNENLQLRPKGRNDVSDDSSHDNSQGHEASSPNSNSRVLPFDYRHSCDGVLSNAFHGQSQGGQRSSLGNAVVDHQGYDYQRCPSNISNRSLNIESNMANGSDQRFISQRQYKRKIRRETPSSSQTCLKINDHDLSNSHDHLNGYESGQHRNSSSSKSHSAVVISKTTYKLRRNAYDSDLDSAGEEAMSDTSGGRRQFELMEIPLSPTHYNQPPTPEEEPPSAWTAESAIHSVLAFLKAEYAPTRATVSTETEPWMLLPLDRSQWPNPNPLRNDRATSMRPERPPGARRELPEIPKDEEAAKSTKSGGQKFELHIDTDSGDDMDSEVVLRKNLPPAGKSKKAGEKIKNDHDNDNIYQYIGGEYEQEAEANMEKEANSEDYDSDSNKVSKSSDSKSQSLSILSPFDEQEEWSKISQIIDSFGADIGKNLAVPSGGEGNGTPNNSPVYDYPTLKRREKLASTIKEWLGYINMEKYVTCFESNGFENLSYMGGPGVMTREILMEIGITDAKDMTVLIDSLRERKNSFKFGADGSPPSALNWDGIEPWLKSLDLSQYCDKFRDNLLVVDMTRVSELGDEELSSIVEIDKLGHRHRILLSLVGTKGIPERLQQRKLSTNSISKASDVIAEPRRMEVVHDKPGNSKAAEKGSETGSLGPACDSEMKSLSSECSSADNSSSLGVKIGSRPSAAKLQKNVESASIDTVPLCSHHLAQRKHNSASSNSESGTLTMGRKKKKAPLPPVQPDSPTSQNSGRSSLSTFKSVEDITGKAGTFSSNFSSTSSGLSIASSSSSVSSRSCPSAAAAAMSSAGKSSSGAVAKSGTTTSSHSSRSATKQATSTSNAAKANNNSAAASGSVGTGSKLPVPTAYKSAATSSKTTSSTPTQQVASGTSSRTAGWNKSTKSMDLGGTGKKQAVQKALSSDLMLSGKTQPKSFKVMYHGNTLVEEFNGMETTRAAIEKVKESRDIINRTGMPTTLVVTENELKTTIFEGQEVLHNHQKSNICCIVYDTDNKAMFAYISTDINNMQRFSHVFSAETKEKAAEILSLVCSGVKEQSKPEGTRSSDSHKGSKTGASGHGQVKSKSDHLVSRMRNFFQGAESSSGAKPRHQSSVANDRESSSSKAGKGRNREDEGRRRRGGSVDNLIDTVGGEINVSTRKKSSSIRNLSSLSILTQSKSKLTHSSEKETSSQTPKSISAKQEHKEVKITSV